jgi:hypothetical protein
MTSKANHVRAATQSRAHTCHWPGCATHVPPAMWGCRKHWMRMPAQIRDAIWHAYVPGQETGTRRVSAEYLEAARVAREWIETQMGEAQ